MGALKDIGTALRTDIGETFRASIDPVFAVKLMDEKFADKRFSRERKQTLEDVARLRQQKLADDKEKERARMHVVLFEKAFETLQESGNAGPLVRLVEQPGFSPVAKEVGIRAINARFPQGFDGAKKELEIRRTTQSMSIEQKRFLLEENRDFNNLQNTMRDDIRAQALINYNQSVDMLNRNQSFINRREYLLVDTHR